MKIGFDAKRLFNNPTGLGNYSRTLVRSIKLYLPEMPLYLYSPQATDNSITAPFWKDDAYTVQTSSHFFDSYWRAVGIKKLLDKDKIDIYHGLSHELPFGIQHCKTKSVVSIHDVISQIMPQHYASFDRLFYHLKLKNALQNADDIVAISQNTKNDLVDFYKVSPQKISVIYQSCDPVFYQEQTQQSQIQAQYELNLPANYLLFVGAHHPRKNLTTLLKAYSRLDLSSRIPLLVVSKGLFSAPLKKLCIRLNILDKVLWRSDIRTANQLKFVYQSAKALIFPSLYEGFGLPIVEALLSKTPVLCSNTAAMPEAAGPDSWFFDPVEEEDILHCLEVFFKHTNDHESRVQKGYEYAMQHFAPQTIAQQWLQQYRSLMR